MHDAVRRIHESAHILRDESPKNDESGKLTEKTVRVLKESGGVRLLQSKECGGFEAHPNDFFEWVRAVAQYSPSAGWIAGVVGVHPWEIALMDPLLQEEIYGQDPDVWTASPYAPIGRAKPVDGGYLFTGEWPYSTGTDYCDWIILGGMVTDEEGNIGNPPDMRHFVLPRSDYEIVEDSWNVMGLSGTGSKNVRMTNSFVPEYRTVVAMKMISGGYYPERQEGHPLYAMSFGATFATAISSGTLGIARGALDAYRDYMVNRVSVVGVVAKVDPFQQEALAEAEADLAASIVHIETWTDRMYQKVLGGGVITQAERLEFRRDQVRAVNRVIDSVDKVFKLAGSAAVWTDKPLERYWRDLHTGASHVCNIHDTAYTSWANFEFETGGPVNTMH
ncbi:MAG: acyl-CoA dehydrogenase [Actinobacteria bacterium]|nr:acyl-CoA dehydrogenase [Actinomycetota bacterium]